MYRHPDDDVYERDRLPAGWFVKPAGRLQSLIHNAGGGIVFDSVEEEEYVETINKLASNVKCIEEAESKL